MTDDLVERVADAIAEAWDREGRIIHAAEAAIAIALEEAAKVADENACDCCFYIAAAIRAMIPTGNAPAQDDPSNAE